MISVIIPAKNAAACLPECLRAVLAQQGLAHDYEVSVVDDGSTDSTAQVAEQFPVQVIRQAHAGPAAARNAGARAARGDILAFTDADCVPAPTWLCELLEPFQNPEVVGVKGAYRTKSRSPVARFVQQEYESKYDRMRKQASIDFVDTYSAAYRRSIFLENGGFDTAFPVPSVEDQELSFRLARKGYRMVFAPAAIVYHPHDRSVGEYLRRKYGIGYWKAVMLRWIPEKLVSDSHTPPSQRWQILLLALSVLAAIAGAAWPPALWAGLISLVLFFLTALPLLVRIAAYDPAVLLLAPVLLLARAAALGVGLGIGFALPPAMSERPAEGLTLGARLAKRLVDIVGALVGLVLSAPVLIVAALAIRLSSPGPALYVQERAGENGKPFRMFKLRTMVVDAERQLDYVLAASALKGPVFKVPNDPRVTRVGAVLRRWSVDELPQFWNVLRGQMSLVGPRPEETWIVARYNDRERRRLAFKPGLSGPMQVAGRGKLNMEERLELELDYIQHYSLRRDLAILLRTIPAILSGEGA